MTNTDWDIDEITKEEIKNHLVEHHGADFNDRRSLNDDDFRDEHFPSAIKHIEEKNCGYLTEEGRALIKKIKQKSREVLKFCEEESIAIARVFDENEKEKGEWRICKPTQDQLDYLKTYRWFRIAAGNFCKVIFQSNMLEEIDEKEIKILAEELQETVISSWKEKQRIVIKRRKKRSEDAN